MKCADPGLYEGSYNAAMTPTDIAASLYFYPTWCGHFFCSDKYFMKRERYKYMLVMFIQKGQMDVEYRSERVEAVTGDLLLLDTTEPHYYHAHDGLEFLYMHFDGSNAQEICHAIIEQQGWLIRRENNLEVKMLLHDVVQHYKSGKVETPIVSSARIYRLFELLLTPTEHEQSRENPIEETMRYVRRNINKRITLKDLAAIAKMSVYYYSHTFKKRTGLAPMEYVIQTRMEHAKGLLIRTPKSVEEIACEVGYASGASFINQFAKKVGMSPSRYRSTRHPSIWTNS